MCSTNFSTQATNVLIVLRSEQSEVCISTITKRGVDQESSFACYDCNNDASNIGYEYSMHTYMGEISQGVQSMEMMSYLLFFWPLFSAI